MKEEMIKKLEEAILACAEAAKRKAATDSNDALKLTQAALNASNELITVKYDN